MTAAASVVIRRAQSDDAARFAPLFDAYRAFYRQPADRAGAERFLRDRLERSEACVFVAESAAQGAPAPAGFTLLYPLFSSTRMAPAWLLNDLFVDPRFRGGGVGRALMRRAIDFARQTGAGSISLATEIANAPAKRLYESLGFRRDDRFDHYALRLE